MRISTKQGRRSEKDRITVVETNGEEVVSFRAILRILELVFQNEDRIYPRNKGHKGRWMLYDAISEVANGKSAEEVANRYLLPKAVKSAKKFMENKING